jgi:hypothetical protein
MSGECSFHRARNRKPARSSELADKASSLGGAWEHVHVFEGCIHHGGISHRFVQHVADKMALGYRKLFAVAGSRLCQRQGFVPGERLQRLQKHGLHELLVKLLTRLLVAIAA